MLARNARRWFLYLALAGSLHGALLLSRGCVHASLASPASVNERPLDVIETALVQDPPQGLPGPAPGGGAIVARPGARLSAPEQRREPSTRARPVEHARERQEHSPQPFATDLLAKDLAEPVEDEPRPHAARRQLLADEPQVKLQGARDAAPQVGSSSASEGTGFGDHGGPGGLGVIGQQFAFGGPAGAFRADVCFIESSVRLLTDISICTPVASFFTSVLNVSPRRFDQGFPGLGKRTEWFAIKYSGKFSVRAEDSYTFRLLSDDGARLEIDGIPVLNNDGQHQPIAVSRNLRLDRGVHDFYLFYYQGPADFLALQLFVQRFDHEEQLFGPVI